MSRFRRLSRHRLLALLAAITLLVQAQSLFACEMMNLSGAVHDCCCDDMPMDTAHNNNVDSGCCSYSQGVTLKGADLYEDGEPLLLQPKPSVDPPLLWLIVYNIFPDSLIDSAVISAIPSIDIPLSSLPGSHTYLATSRLRI